jgi:hypothetical protein
MGVRVVVGILAVTFVSGCATVKETYMPDGSKGYRISCDGATVGMNVCVEKAGDLCGAAGYDLIDRQGRVASYGVESASMQALATEGPLGTKSIMIRCRK